MQKWTVIKMRCDNCFHKEICVHRVNILNSTYGYMRNNFNPDECDNYILCTDIVPVKQGYIVWKERHRGGFRTAKCLHHFNDINMEHNTPCKHIAKIDERYTINEPYCSECGKLLGDFLIYCGNCGAKMDGDKNE